MKAGDSPGLPHRPRYPFYKVGPRLHCMYVYYMPMGTEKISQFDEIHFSTNFHRLISIRYCNIFLLISWLLLLLWKGKTPIFSQKVKESNNKEFPIYFEWNGILIKFEFGRDIFRNVFNVRIITLATRTFPYYHRIGWRKVFKCNFL